MIDREFYHQQFPGMEDKVDSLFDSMDLVARKTGKYILNTTDFEHFYIEGYVEIKDEISTYPIEHGERPSD